MVRASSVATVELAVKRTSSASNQPQRRAAPGDGAELLASLLKLYTEFIMQLAGHRSGADPGSIRLCNANNSLNPAWGYPQPGTCPA